MYYSDELYHHGILGQKWGVRRYQNKDGSLTKAGIRRYGTIENYNKVQKAVAKAVKDKEDARLRANVEKDINKAKKRYGIMTPEEKRADEARKAKKAAKESNDEQLKENKELKKKSINEMTDDEIRQKIERIKLENELKNLTPEKISRGKKFLNGLADAAIPAITNAAKDGIEKYLKKAISKKLGLDQKTVESEAEKLANKAKEMQNRADIARNEDFLNERNARIKKQEQEAKAAAQKEKETQREKAKAEAQTKNEERRAKMAEAMTKAPDKTESDAERAREKAEREARKAREKAEREARKAREKAEREARKAAENPEVTGEGRNTRKPRSNDVIDVEWTDVVENYPAVVNSGKDYVRRYLALTMK